LTLVVPLLPPATSTFPLVVALLDVLSCTAPCSWRAPVMLAVAAQVPVVRSKSSAEVSSAPDVPSPPTTSPLPVESTVAVCACRAVAMDPVVDHVGSSRAGYTTPSFDQRTRTVQASAIGRVTGLAHGDAGLVSTVRPSPANVAS